ncbi:baseplate J/gp47 family protein [Acetobacter orientalis]|uniref:baseplate J/gp47 family protein n=1 Tax=Acetobacter orientalis TaxID=146474 RepID=UPI0020A57557|nr:baseplate J/gp47 family protein [Acetobacter orientalis]
MPYPRKTLSSLQASVWSDIVTSNVVRGLSLLSRSILRPLSWAFANLAWSNDDYIAWCYRQCVPWTAEGENLDAWAALPGVYKKDATAASGIVLFSGCVPGTELAAATAIMRADGVSYATSGLAVAGADGTLSASVACDTTGADGNCDSGIAFALLTAVPGMPSSGLSSGAMTGGADIETEAAFRTRMLKAYASRDGGGRQDDYVEWATAVAGVTRAWCNPSGAGSGSVVVYAMLDDAQATHNGFPQGANGAATNEPRYTTATGDQLSIANAIRLNQPVTALVVVCAPWPYQIDVKLSDLSANASVQIEAIRAALADLFVRSGTPLGMTIPQSDIEEAVLSTGVSFTLSAPLGPTNVPLGSLPVVGEVSAE